jgi:hypothetical protein
MTPILRPGNSHNHRVFARFFASLRMTKLLMVL